MVEKLERQRLIANYNRIPKTISKNLPKRVYIWDETLRDGEQTPGVFLTVNEKIEIAKLMDEVGIAIITVGYPAASKMEKNAVKAIAREKLSASLAAPARPVKSDIDACIEADAEEVPIFIGTSDLNLRYVIRMSRKQVKERVSDSIQYAKKHGVVVDFIAMDASRTDLRYLLDICKVAVDAGADKICFADTVGFIRPSSMRYAISRIREAIWKVKKVPLSAHCHNDFGLATANTLAAVEEGVVYPHTGVNGYGERSGNASLEETVMALEVLYGVDTGVKTDRLYELAMLTEKYFAVPIAAHKALVGTNSFSHEAGIHVHGQMMHPLAFEPIPPESVGRHRQFFLGKFTGTHIVESKLKERNIKVSDAQVAEIVKRVKELHETRGKEKVRKDFERVKIKIQEMRSGVRDDEFWKIVEKVAGKRGL